MSFGLLGVLRQVLKKNLFMKSNSPSLKNLKMLIAKYSSSIGATSNIRGFKNEVDVVFPGDPDTFGTLCGKWPQNVPEDDGDREEEEFTEQIPARTNQLTTKQYADLIKQFVQLKRLKDAIDVLEVKMLKEDRVKPENYIYNILIGACADVGYTKKAFKLYNDMKRRALKVTGDTYTCLFNACAKSPWPADGLKNAIHLRHLMKEKRTEPNLTNYNSMIKAFGHCGDLSTAFQIVDEMASKKIKIRVHTFNFLLQACITDKEHGLRHAIIVWRKMLLKREKPNIYSFNLMLKCTKECNFGTQEDIIEALSILAKTGPLMSNSNSNNNDNKNKTLELKCYANFIPDKMGQKKIHTLESFESLNRLKVTSAESKLQLVESSENSLTQKTPTKSPIPNLIAKNLQINDVVSIKNVDTPQDKFSFIGGLEGFMQEMNEHNVKPDLKTMTAMLELLPENNKEEIKLLDMIKEHGIRTDMYFYNVLMRRRCFRCDYESAKEVEGLINEENAALKKFHPLKRRKLSLKYNLLTYGCLAMTCSTKNDASQLIEQMNEVNIKVNIEILGSMLSTAVTKIDFGYTLYILKHVQDLDLKPNEFFMKHLEDLQYFCEKRINKNAESNFADRYKSFNREYGRWLQKMATSGALKVEHPWQQFRENYPETVQRQNIITFPSRFFKQKRKHPKPYQPL